MNSAQGHPLPLSRPYNFSAGPAALPPSVLQTVAQQMLDWQGSGMSVMEMSHRGPEFQSIYQHAHDTLRRLLQIPQHFKILFMQGGGLAENAIVPLNLSRGGVVDFVVSGAWSKKSFVEAAKYCQPMLAASAEPSGFTEYLLPQDWRLSPQASYVHLCSNETIHGVEYHELPDLAALGSRAPLVIDCSSHILSRAIDWSKVGLAYAGAQKNIGPAGLTIVIVREDLLDQALEICPSAFHYKTVAEHGSMYNTPPTFAIYVAGLVFDWIEEQGGVAALEARNRAKAALLYDCIDQSSLYANPVVPQVRSRMNIPFFLRDGAGELLRDASHPLNARFLAGAKARGLLQLKGHKSVGAMRASIYNAMPLEGVQALVDYMVEFERCL